MSTRGKNQSVSVSKLSQREITHLVIDYTRLKVLGECGVKSKHSKERRPARRKLHLTVDSNTHKIICVELLLNNIMDSETIPGLIWLTHRKKQLSRADAAYYTWLCHDELRRKKISALIPPQKGAGYWPAEYADRNCAVANQ